MKSMMSRRDFEEILNDPGTFKALAKQAFDLYDRDKSGFTD